MTDDAMTDDEIIAFLQERLFTPAAALRAVPMTDAETGYMLRLMSAIREGTDAVWQKASADGLRESQIVENVCARFRRPTHADAKLFLTLLLHSPGDAVLYLSFAHIWLRDQGKPELDLSTLCEIFPAGFWSEEERLTLWNAQKLPAASCRALGTDNGLDTPAVRAWINDGEPPPASTLSRSEHLAWAKARALAALDAEDQTDGSAISAAFTSLASDLGKHPDTEGHLGLQLGLLEMMGGHLATREKMRRHIEGYN